MDTEIEIRGIDEPGSRVGIFGEADHGFLSLGICPEVTCKETGFD